MAHSQSKEEALYQAGKAESPYLSAWYLSPARFSSIGWQYKLCRDCGASSFLDVGAGHNMLVWLLRRVGLRVVSLDRSWLNEPDVLGLLPHLPLADGTVEVALCFQVLEHLPLALLEPCLAELARVASRQVLISLPDRTTQPPLRVRIARAVYNVLRFPPRWKPVERQPSIDPEHCWELGVGGVSPQAVIAVAARCGLHTTAHFRNDLFPYHHFFTFDIR